MPAFCYQRILVIFGALKHGLLPDRRRYETLHQGNLSKFVTARGSIQFPLAQPPSLSLIRKIVALRVRPSVEQDGKWRSKKIA
jgi:uncharacterized protein YdhG (YjbR/CyaY superfamily)